MDGLGEPLAALLVGGEEVPEAAGLVRFERPARIHGNVVVFRGRRFDGVLVVSFLWQLGNRAP